ncbi:hypothetical protein DEU56DRAFT_759038 [Suillus clintonianus]|uniref:uncharacterized protein n=1 Tax=Suillus clintonianus TaxID=1904413 RepID=UPI001B860A72|nr:uncharacterized protein DEU56DRAFT_759038 [Suillus clintonianus]KAG2126071.1 hypothetical protein DEU56DRAFT_759038 [Suillus clintonianus]
MSRSLLFQLYLNTPDPSDERMGTRASGSKAYPAPMITHVYNDDLESMFYVFIWVCIEFRGPLGMKRVLPTTLPHSNQKVKWITGEWSASTYQKCGDSKTRFFHQSDHYTMELAKQFDPYFKSLLPLALAWYELHIAALPSEDSPELLVSKWVILSAAGSFTTASGSDEDTSGRSSLDDGSCTQAEEEQNWVEFKFTTLDSYFRKMLYSVSQDSPTLPACGTGDPITSQTTSLKTWRGPVMSPRASQKKSKRKAVDSDGQANSAKKSRAGAKASVVLQEPISADKPSVRRSGRSGAGKGGRVEQLEKIGALLDAPARTTQPKGSTSLDIDVPTNPLAPEPPRKGRGNRTKAETPPPYTVSETVEDPATSKTGGKKGTSKATKKDLDVSNMHPAFSHRQSGSRFGFAQPIVPPGTEPDLQYSTIHM